MTKNLNRKIKKLEDFIIRENFSGEKIREIRILSNLTMEEFAEKIQEKSNNKIKTTKSNVSKWEKGLNRPNIRTATIIGEIASEVMTQKDYEISISKYEYNHLKEIERKYNEIKALVND